MSRPRLDRAARRRLLVAGVVAAWLVVPGSLAAVLILNRLVTDAGRPDLAQTMADGVVYILAMVSASTVGAALAIRRPRHPVGWLFLALGGSLAAGTAMIGYATYGAIARPGSLPLAAVAGVVGDYGFFLWMVIIALVFHLTPDGRPVSQRWAVLLWVTVAAGGLAFLTGLVSGDALDPPVESIQNPMALSDTAGMMSAFRTVTGFATGAGVFVGALSLLTRYQRATGLERRQLLWLAPAAVFVPVFVAASFVASYADDEAVLGVVAALFVVLLPLAAALAITRYHLYDVDRILSRALTYALLSAVLAAVYVVVVVAVGAAVGESQLSAVVATLAAVSVAGPAHRRLQDAVDRRFNRRRFEAVRMVRDYVRDPAPDVSIEDVLRRAVGDPALWVSYWVEGRHEWVTGDGRPAEVGVAKRARAERQRDDEPARAERQRDDERARAVRQRDGEIVLRIHDRVIARIGSAGAARELVEAAVAEARPELDNAGLRAAVALQLVEVRESRARIVSAADASRREIERNLHDGAQQRLVALAVKLGLARKLVDRNVAPLLEELRTDVQETLIELRDLAHGIYPPLLREHGLGEALRTAANRAGSPTTVEVTAGRRYDPEAEAAVYFCCLEAMQNAGKHAGDRAEVLVRVAEDGEELVFEVCDDGAGFDLSAAGASQGFVNMRDRLGAFGGRLLVDSGPGRGTVVRGTLPLTAAEPV